MSGCTSATSNRRDAARFIDLSGKTDLVALGGIDWQGAIVDHGRFGANASGLGHEDATGVLFGQTNPFRW